MYPVLFSIGGFTITTFGLMLFLSIMVGAWVLSINLRRRGMDPEIAWDMVLWLALGGIIGAKIYYVLLHWPLLVADPFGLIFSRGGLVWYGGLFGGSAAFYWQIRKHDLPTLTMFDLVAAPLALAYAIGRLGCFLVGDDYGLPTDSWVGVVFPRDAAVPSTAGYFRSLGVEIPASVPDAALLAVHPTQLYEIAAGLAMFAILWQVGKRHLRPGRLFALFLAFYGIERFLIEFVRAKDDRFFFGLTTSQVASMLMLGLAAYLWQRHSRARPAAESTGGDARGVPAAQSEGRGD